MEKCPDIPIEKLIEYCDGELSPNEANMISEHISECQICRTNIEALQNSIKAVQDIWQSDENKWINLHSFHKPKLHKRSFKRIASIAASIIIICGASFLWLQHKSNEPENGNHPLSSFAEIKMEAEHAAFAAQLLAVGDMYAAQAGAEKYAIERYNDIIESYPSSPQSEKAILRLQKLLEREI